MIAAKYFQQVSAYIWELSPDYVARMRVPVRIYGSRAIFEQAFHDHSVQQLINVAMLPGLVKYAMAMPDMHQGYGFPIGGVAAFDYRHGVVSPGGVGYDINCGVRLLASNVLAEEVHPYLEKLTATLYHFCPSGVGGKGAVHLNPQELDEILVRGAAWAVTHGYATRDDVERTESKGTLPGARAGAVPARAKKRGLPQLGSLGAGNHFIELDVIAEVYDEEVARTFGLVQGNIALQIHCGSRGLGHEVCGQYLRRLQHVPQRYALPDRELVAAPVNSPEGRDYLAAMAAAANYAFVNRQVLAHFARQAFEKVLAGKVKDWSLHQVYDVAHNIAKVERHRVESRDIKLVVHRKGATRAFPSGHPELPTVYRQTGHPVLVPGSMGTGSYVLVGTEAAMEQTFGSTCHGAGRRMSRRKALKTIRGTQVRAELNRLGVVVHSGSMRGLAEEAPLAYKDVDEVVASVVGAGIARQVAKLRPLAVIKG